MLINPFVVFKHRNSPCILETSNAWELRLNYTLTKVHCLATEFLVKLYVCFFCDEGSAVKLKSFTVVTFSVCTECCSLSLRDGKCSKRIFLAADGLILGEALRFFNMD